MIIIKSLEYTAVYYDDFVEIPYFATAKQY